LGEIGESAPDNKPVAIDVLLLRTWPLGRSRRTEHAGAGSASTVGFGSAGASEERPRLTALFPGNMEISLVVSQTTRTANDGKFISSIPAVSTKAARIAVREEMGGESVGRQWQKQEPNRVSRANQGTFAGNLCRGTTPVERLVPYVERALQASIAKRRTSSG